MIKKRQYDYIFVLNSFGRGGAEISLYNLSQHLSKRNYSILFIGLRHVKNSYCFKSQKNLTLLVLSESYTVAFLKLGGILNSNKSSIIVSAMFISDFFCSFLTKNSINHFVSIRLDLFKFYEGSLLKKFIILSFLKFVPNIIFISKKHYENFTSKFKKNFAVSFLFNSINSGLNEKTFNSCVTKSLNNIGNDTVRFTIVSRLVRGKGIMRFLTSYKTIIKKYNFIINIYGEGNLVTELNRYVEDNQLCQNIFYNGYSNNISQVYKNTDILIFPSLSEGFGRVAFEAVLNGSFVFWNSESSLRSDFPFLKSMILNYNSDSSFINNLEYLKFSKPDDLVEEFTKLRNLLSIENHVSNFLEITSNDCITI